MKTQYLIAGASMTLGVRAQLNIDITQAGQPEHAQCGGRTYSGPSQCDTGLECVFVSDTYYQCLRPGGSPSQQSPQSSNPGRQTTFVTATAPPAATNAAPKPGAYQQCGGSGYTGSRECQPGYQCVVIDTNFSLCEVHSVTVTQTVTVTVPIPVGGATATQHAPTTPTQSNGGSSFSNYLGQCSGQQYTGPTRCAQGLVCVVLNQWYGQCLYPGQSIGPAPVKD